MKKIFTLLIIAVFAMPVLADDAPKTKKVCTTDAKTKKETCKTIKIHKKLEGTKVPTKK